jgi:hypothetical protein
VNAPYAFFKQRLIQYRKSYRPTIPWLSRTAKEAEAVLQVFRDNKDKMRALIIGFELLDLKERQTMVNYFDDFYSTINNKKMVKYEFMDGARKH